MEEGNEIRMRSSCSGTVRTHKESGQQEREKEWTGGTESYSLAEINGVTTLIVKIDVPLEQEETFNVRFPKALERIKTLAEKTKVKIIL